MGKLSAWDEKGFTLAELMIVIAIIGVLAAVSIPVFGGLSEKARRAVCESNRTSAEHAAVIGALTSGSLTKEQAESAIESCIGSMDKLCPSGGTCSLEDENGDGTRWKVTCSKHGETALQKVSRTPAIFWDSSVTTKVIDYYRTRSASSPSRMLDSTGVNWGKPVKEAVAKKLGITTAFDFEIVRTGSDSYTVTLYDELPSADKYNADKSRYSPLPVTQYTIKGGKQTKKQEGTATLKEKTKEGSRYVVIDAITLKK